MRIEERHKVCAFYHKRPALGRHSGAWKLGGRRERKRHMKSICGIASSGCRRRRRRGSFMSVFGRKILFDIIGKSERGDCDIGVKSSQSEE